MNECVTFLQAAEGIYSLMAVCAGIFLILGFAAGFHFGYDVAKGKGNGQ